MHTMSITVFLCIALCIALCAGFRVFLKELSKLKKPDGWTPDLAHALSFTLLWEAVAAVPAGIANWVVGGDMLHYALMIGCVLIASFIMVLPLFWVILYVGKMLASLVVKLLQGFDWVADKVGSLFYWWSKLFTPKRK